MQCWCHITGKHRVRSKCFCFVFLFVVVVLFFFWGGAENCKLVGWLAIRGVSDSRIPLKILEKRLSVNKSCSHMDLL